MKRTIVAFLAGVLLATAGSVYAEDIKTLIGKQIQGEIPVKINGEELDKKAIYVDGTSYLPVRAIGDALGMDVKYDADLGVELTPKEGEAVDTAPESPVEVAPVPMSEEDADSIKTSEEQLSLAETRIKDNQDRIKRLESEKSAETENLSKVTSPEERQIAEMKILGIEAEIASAREFIKANEEIILSTQAYIEKIKKKYE